MTLENTLRKKLADWRPPEGRRDLTVTDETSGWAVTLSADRGDVLGCLVWEMSARRLSASTGQNLRGWADRIAGRVTGLLEPLKVVEVDTERAEAILRSETPSQQDNKFLYYEVLLRNTTQATVRRYQAGRDGAKRAQVAFALTHEGLAKLAADLSW